MYKYTPDDLKQSKSSVMASYDEVEAICKFLRTRVSIKPQVGIICGSGLGHIGHRVANKVVVPYDEIPGFPRVTVEGHLGLLVFGELSGKLVMVMQGRFHTYEGYTQQQITLPVLVMKLMGCEYLFTTDATSGLHPNYDSGDLVIIKDHISIPALAGINPLNGPNDERFGPRFPALSNVYNRSLRQKAMQAAEEMGIDHLIHEGVYVCCCGPSYATPAEARVLHLLGADVDGMCSTAETIVAHHMGMKILAISLVVSRELFEVDRRTRHKKIEEASHEEVLAISAQRGETIATLLTRVLASM